ncbi:MAG: hypothetical protein BAJATHORv1_30467 [Candidatus Thorarchaeota archaeon]|nr:MAG: hypothetical protein BAJATHORv1_30467 [Candidatus Thorarchaeota archaeon]
MRSKIFALVVITLLVVPYMLPLTQPISYNHRTDASNLDTINESKKDITHDGYHPMFTDRSVISSHQSSNVTVLARTSTSQDINFEKVWYQEYDVEVLNPNVFRIGRNWVSLDVTFWARLTLTVPVRIQIIEPDTELLSGTVQQAVVSVETLSAPQYCLDVGFDAYLDYRVFKPKELALQSIFDWHVETPEPRPSKYNWSTSFEGEFWAFSPSGRSHAPWGFHHEFVDNPLLYLALRAVPWYEGKLSADIDVSGGGAVASSKTYYWNAVENKVIPIEIDENAGDGDPIELTLSNINYKLRCGIDWFAEVELRTILALFAVIFVRKKIPREILLATFPETDWITLTPTTPDAMSVSMTTTAMRYDHVNIHVKRVISSGDTEPFPIHSNSYATLTLTQWDDFNNWWTVFLNSDSVATFVDLDPELRYCWVLMIDGVVVATSSSFYEMGSSIAPEDEHFVWDNTQENVDLLVTTDMTGYVDITFSAFNSTGEVLESMEDTTIWIGKIEPNHGDYWAAITNPEAFNMAMMGDMSVDLLSLRYLTVDDNGQTFWTQNTRPNGQYKIWVVQGFEYEQGWFTEDQVIFEKEISITQSGNYILIGDQTQGLDSLKILRDLEDPETSSSSTMLYPSYEVSGRYHIGGTVQVRMRVTDDIEVPMAWAELDTGHRISMTSFGNGYFYTEINLRTIETGSQNITLDIMDVAGKTDSIVIPVHIDNTAPIIEDIDITTSSGTSTFSCNVYDDTPIYSAEVYYLNGDVVQSQSLSITQGNPAVISGTFPESDDFYVEISDYVLNTGYYDTTPPNITILNDYERIDLNHMRIHLDVSDFGSGLDSYLVLFNGSLCTSDTGESFVLDLRIPSIGPAQLEKEWNWTLDGGPMYRQLHAGDLNGDGYDDLVWTCLMLYDDNGTTMFLHLLQALDGKTRTLILNETISDSDLGWDNVLDPCIYDFDGDGKDEIAFASHILGNVRLFDGETGSILWTHSLGGYIHTSTEPDRVIGEILVGEFDGSGHKDILLTRGYGAYAVDGSTGFYIWKWNSTYSYCTMYDFTVGNFNADGYDDLYVLRNDGLFYIIDGNGGIEDLESWSIDIKGIASGDVLPAEGIECLTITGDKVGSVYENVSLCIWDSTGELTFYNLPYGENSSLSSVYIEIANADSEGLDEVIVKYSYNNGTHTIYQIRCIRPTTGETIWYKYSSEKINEIKVVDVNQDGSPEVIAAYDFGVGANILRVYDGLNGASLAEGMDNQAINLNAFGDYDADGQVEYAYRFSDEIEVWDLWNDAGSLIIGGWVNITIIAEDGTGNNATDSVIIDITDIDAPAAPTIVSSSANDTAVEFTWSESAGPNVVGYEIYRGNGTSPSPHAMDPIAEVSSSITSYTDDELLPGKYHYCVLAIDEDDVRSARSNEISHLVGDPIDWYTFGGPETPWHIRLNRTETGVELTWNTPSSPDITGIRIYRDDESINDISVGVHEEVGATVVEFTESLEEDEGYWYALTAIDSEGRESPLSISMYSGTLVQPVNTATPPSLIDQILGILLHPATLIIIAVVVVVLILVFRE